MSLILEALRKSEAERRRATVPDLLAESAAAAPATVRASQPWPWIAGGAVLVAGFAWFALLGRGTTPTIATHAEAPAPDTVAEQAPAAARPAPTAPAQRAPAVQRPLVVAAPAPAAPRTAAPASLVVADAPRPAPIAPLPRTAPIQAPPAATFDPTERIADLGADERKQLPPLKLSMHMWNDAATQRFVIIDGARLRIGDHIGQVVVADILPDGVLLDWNGRALKLPLR